jgi:NAD(P)-dependent dehydrogenase (short-subunit alcohol dehydrogenase family)
MTSDKFDLKDRVVVVTGGAGILGRLYCLRLAERGASVVMADLEESRYKELAEEIRNATGAACLGLALNLTDEASVVDFAEEVWTTFGRVDVLVNNAAAKSPNFFAPLEKFPLDDWNSIMAVNVTGMFLTAREIGGRMAARGQGSIINVSSIYGVVGPDQRIYEGSHYEDMGGAINTPLVYSTSKGAVVALTRYLAAYWGHRGVRTNTLTPGGVFSGQNEEFQKNYGRRVPMGRMAEAEEMVGALLFLASDASSYVNGQNIIVDGGWTAW